MSLQLLQHNQGPFKIRNFPEECNPHVKGAGPGTQYLILPVNQPGGQGFRMLQDAAIVNGTGMVLKDQYVYFTLPGKLYKASDIGIGGHRSRSYFASFSTKSSNPEDAMGLIPISSVAKASQPSSRAVTGKIGQDAVYQYFTSVYSHTFKSITQLQCAHIGSKAGDLIIDVDGTPLQIEVKSYSSSAVTLFDKVVGRQKDRPIINMLVEKMSGGKHPTLTSLIDEVRLTDPSFGYPGDPGVINKSGKLTGIRIYQSDAKMHEIYKVLIGNFHQSKDNYFAVHNHSGTISLYHTGLGENVIKAPPLPLPIYVELRPYGGPSAGGMRVGVKVKL